MDVSKIQALISLLDDTDTEVVSAVTDNLMQHGITIVPHLEKVWENTPDSRVQERLERVIYDIQFETTRTNLRNWKNGGATNILEGASYLVQFQFPETSFFQIDDRVEKIKNDVWLEIGTNLTAVEKVKIINYVLFELHKFARNTHNFYSPQNSFLNQVLETRKGNPLSLAILYKAIADKLNLPIYGVNLPKNFILAYKDEYRYIDSQDEIQDIIFYINPYNKGAILSKKEIDYFLEQNQLKPDKSYYVPCSNEETLVRLINGLIVSYEKLGFEDKMTRLCELLQIFQ